MFVILKQPINNTNFTALQKLRKIMRYKNIAYKLMNETRKETLDKLI